MTLCNSPTPDHPEDHPGETYPKPYPDFVDLIGDLAHSRRQVPVTIPTPVKLPPATDIY